MQQLGGRPRCFESTAGVHPPSSFMQQCASQQVTTHGSFFLIEFISKFSEQLIWIQYLRGPMIGRCRCRCRRSLWFKLACSQKASHSVGTHDPVWPRPTNGKLLYVVYAARYCLMVVSISLGVSVFCSSMLTIVVSLTP